MKFNTVKKYKGNYWGNQIRNQLKKDNIFIFAYMDDLNLSKRLILQNKLLELGGQYTIVKKKYLTQFFDKDKKISILNPLLKNSLICFEFNKFNILFFQAIKNFSFITPLFIFWKNFYNISQLNKFLVNYKQLSIFHGFYLKIIIIKLLSRVKEKISYNQKIVFMLQQVQCNLEKEKFVK